MSELDPNIPQAPTLGHRPRVLFVDDEPRILTSLRMLCRRRYDVRIAEGGDAALAVLREHPVDVLVSDQRMPGMTGFELLREARSIQPGAMRLLLTGYADLNAIIGSINEGEIFRFISKPWVNDELLAIIDEAAAAAAAAPVPAAPAAPTPADADPDPQTEPAQTAGPAVLVLDPSPARRAEMAGVLGGSYRVIEAADLDTAVERLQSDDIGVMISDVRVENTRIVELLGLLKTHAPNLVSIIVTERADAHDAIDLINRSQVYRFLVRPLRQTMCRISVRSALERHHTLRQNPEQTRRYAARPVTEEPVGLGRGLIDRIRRMRQRLQPGASA
ncbi:response regulator [Salinisphaera sp. P385]|uniref:Response regulator n=1 Tax=Spectribacter acetivorans TaxID=3075603 RepID=A0ABU3B5V1_9GAMM|nr:response regulator [Salinisphaera sp. P385]MDT0617207.1 response regulator [Salinisphaera sp. P385]